jgi:hypothetical protein
VSDYYSTFSMAMLAKLLDRAAGDSAEQTRPLLWLFNRYEFHLYNVRIVFA